MGSEWEPLTEQGQTTSTNENKTRHNLQGSLHLSASMVNLLEIHTAPIQVPSWSPNYDARRHY